MTTLRIRSITWEAEGIRSFELVSPEGEELPAFDAGAHLDVQIPGGISRRYSLCNPPWERHRYVIAVLDVPNSRGGSRAMHRNLRAGDLIDVSGPHNFFPLAQEAERSILLAGGIGVTPIMAMYEQLRRDGRPVELHYCTKSPDHTAFRTRLRDGIEAGYVSLHHDGGDPSKGLDIAKLLENAAPSTHVYYCGPTGFMGAVRDATSHWPQEQVHFEYFGQEPTARPKGESHGQEVHVVLERLGRTIPVDPTQTILEALRASDVECESSCEAGMCGTCKVRYLEGSPEHNDLILSEDEREEYVLVCCARAGSDPLVLDL